MPDHDNRVQLASLTKGKIERFFRTLQTQFHPTLTFEPVACLDQLNRRFWRWLETDYHQREHGSLVGQSPAQRFATVGPTLRTPPTSPNLERLFLMRLPRRVRKDATISLGGQLWEVPVHLRGQIVTVHFDPVNWTCVELWIGDRCLGHAHPCNKHLNAQLRSSNDYERDWS